MDLRTMLLGVVELKYGHLRGKQQPAQQHLRQVRAELTELVPVGMGALVSGSAQSLPIVPWIAILNKDVTTTAQEGLYVVYLYSSDLKRVYLSMNQGATQHRRNALGKGIIGVAADRAAISELYKESHLIHQGLDDRALAGLIPTVELDDSRQFLPKAYEAGSITAIPYDTAQIPTSGDLQADLDRFLALYTTCVEIKRDILASDPGLIGTPAGKWTGDRVTQRPPIFRPRSSDDYVANVVAQSQKRTRRHEELIAKFGGWIKSRGFKPANNVHPCDLTVSDSGHHWLVEAKTVDANSELAVRAAIGQLLSYRHFVYRERRRPDPNLVALFTEPVGAAFAELLVSLDIEAIWWSAGRWEGKAPSSASCLLSTVYAASSP